MKKLNLFSKSLNLNKKILRGEGEIMYLISAILLSIYLSLIISILGIVKNNLIINGYVRELGRRMSILSSFNTFDSREDINKCFEDEKRNIVKRITNNKNLKNIISKLSIYKIDSLLNKDITAFRIYSKAKVINKIGFVSYSPIFVSYFLLRGYYEN